MNSPILLSATNFRNDEHELLVKFFERGLEYFHLRKPDASPERLVAWMEKLPEKWHSRVSVHGPFSLAASLGVGGVHLRETDRSGLNQEHFRSLVNAAVEGGYRISASVHEVADLLKLDGFDYAFLSPVMDSISKRSRKGEVDKWQLPDPRPCPIVGLGGISADNVEEAMGYGFDGVAVLGDVWLNEDPLKAWKKMMQNYSKALQSS